MIAKYPKVALERFAIEEKALPEFSALEIGAGCGQFLLDMAAANPQVKYLGVEVNRTAFAISIKKFDAVQPPLTNIAFLNADAENLLPQLADESLDVLYLNFNDPWPKKKHHRRRLTYPVKLQEYYRILKPRGKLLIKTDNVGYFEDSVGYFQEFNRFLVKAVRNYETEPGDMCSEYEKKFRLQDRPIYRIEALKP